MLSWMACQPRVAPRTRLARATVSFLASRAAPSLQFFFALGGGIALARAAHARGRAHRLRRRARRRCCQTVAVMGPARINAPLTQAITAPMMGRLQARGARPLTEFLACLALRLVHYAVLLAAFIFVILGGLDEFTGSYETLTGWLGIVPQGPTAALVVTAVGQTCWAIFFSTCRSPPTGARSATGRPSPTAARRPPRRPPRRRAERAAGRFDPRAVVRRRAAGHARCCSRARPGRCCSASRRGSSRAWLLSRPDHDAVPLGARARRPARVRRARPAGCSSGAGLELTLQRVLRAVLLVAVATWMRAAAGPGRAARGVPARAAPAARAPAVREAAALMEGLDAGPRLVAAARAAADRFADVALAPAPLADAVTAGWRPRRRATAPGAPAPPARRCGCARPDALLVALTLAPALALLGA